MYILVTVWINKHTIRVDCLLVRRRRLRFLGDARDWGAPMNIIQRGWRMTIKNVGTSHI